MAATLPILTFHDITTQRAPISFRPDVFKRGLRELHERGYRTINLARLARLLMRGNALPDKRFVITFDDGFRSVFAVAFPVLQQLDMTATIFIITGRREAIRPAQALPSWEGRTMLTWNQLRELQRHGFEIGAHTLTHPDLTRLAPDQMRAEVVQSKNLIEENIAAPVESFAYPYGRFDARAKDLVGQVFNCACTADLGFVTTTSDRLALNRIDTCYFKSIKLFRILKTRWLPVYLALRKGPRQLKIRLSQNKAL